MLIDHFVPIYNVTERHTIKIRAPIEQVYKAMHTADLLGSPIIRGLFFLRNLPTRIFSHHTPILKLDGTLNKIVARGGFLLLSENPPHEFLMGRLERIWAVPAPDIPIPKDATTYHHFDTPGFAKAVMNFSLWRQSDSITRLGTETRVFCLDEKSWQRFRLYWLFIGPFSALIRRIMLRAIKKEAEKGQSK